MGDGKFLEKALANAIARDEDLNFNSIDNSEIALALEELVDEEFLELENIKEDEEESIEEERLLHNNEDLMDNSYNHFANYLAMNESDSTESAYNEYIGYKLEENDKEEYIPIHVEVQDRVEQQIDDAQQAQEWGFVYTETYTSAVQEVQTKFYKAVNMTFIWLVYELKENGYWGE